MCEDRGRGVVAEGGKPVRSRLQQARQGVMLAGSGDGYVCITTAAVREPLSFYLL